jgi:hypothetical protein
LNNDQVSVVHPGETDTMPNREAQDAYADEADSNNSTPSTDPYGANPTDHYIRASEQDNATREPAPEDEAARGLEEADTPGLSGADPENPTDAGSTPKDDDENDFEAQQELAELAGPGAGDEVDTELDERASA